MRKVGKMIHRSYRVAASALFEKQKCVICQRAAALSCSSSASSKKVKIEDVLSNENKERVQKVLQKRKISPVHSADKRQRNTAVLVPLCSVQGVPSLLLTKRSSKLNSHRSEISFPGGKIDEADGNDPVVAAVRECVEEIGVRESEIDVWGDVVASVSTFVTGRYLSTPVIASLGNFEDLQFNLSHHEVAQIFTVPLEHLNDSSNQTYTVFKMSTRQSDLYSTDTSEKSDRPRMMRMPAFRHPQLYIWGMTSFVICGVVPLIYPGFRHNAPLRFY